MIKEPKVLVAKGNQTQVLDLYFEVTQLNVTYVPIFHGEIVRLQVIQ